MYGRKIRKGEYEFIGINEYGSSGTLYHVAYGVIRIKNISAAERQLLCETYSLEEPDAGDLEIRERIGHSRLPLFQHRLRHGRRVPVL